MSVSDHTDPHAVTPPTGPRYWRSLDEYADTPAFKDWVESEFPQGASDLNGVNRRHFLKIMAAGFAAAGVAGASGCRRPEAYVRPYAKESERIKPGTPVYYATSRPGPREHLPLVVQTYGARPTKIEGNPAYLPTKGATDIFSQASILDLYDPDRATRSSMGSQVLTSAEVKTLLGDEFNRARQVKGKGLAILLEPSTSPTRARLLADLQKALPQALVASYEAIPTGGSETALSELFDQPVRALPDFKKAKRILSLEADFIHQASGGVEQARAFADGRRVLKAKDAEKMSRLYMVESGFSVTGTMADHRLRLASARLSAFAALFAADLLKQAGADADLVRTLEGRAGNLSVDAKWVHECAADLLAHRGKSVIVVADHAPAGVHQLVALLNEILDAPGKVLRYAALPAMPEMESIETLAARLNDNAIETLVICGGNPAFDAPAGLAWTAAQKKAKKVIRHAYSFDETSLEATHHIAGTHFLESWGDGHAWDGTLVPVQPMILPLFEGISEIELLARLSGRAEADSDTYALIRETFTQVTGQTEESAFTRYLRDGVQTDSAFASAEVTVNRARLRSLLARANWTVPPLTGETDGGLEVRFLADNHTGDGRFANNGWMQECPDPMTKLTWDNAFLVGPVLASKLGFDTASGRFLISGVAKKSAEFLRAREISPLAEVSVDGVTVKGPLHVVPGLADETIIAPVGYGRRKVGRVGAGTGFDAYPLKRRGDLAVGASIRLTGETTRLANTQMHWSMEARAIVRESTTDYYKDNPKFVDKMGMESHSPANYGKDKKLSLQEKVTTQPRGASLYDIPQFTAPQQWGMSIDLNTCTGCNACVVACQSENNIPIVGKDQIMRGREMHWIRLDRYFSSGDPRENRESLPADPQVSLMPMACQHCEMAPCEQVCPVNATVHDEQGLNVMAYNRCVGTRYCSNNCPYKVRRYNFFDWNKREIDHYYEGPLGPNKYEQGAATELQKMRANPEVTIRMRGVMEKCTYCQQRIENAKIAQKVKAMKDPNVAPDDVIVPDGVIRTACQQACPSGAIVFGDLADAETEVSRTKESDRNYSVLGYLNVRPRTTYLARLRNLNKKMPDYSKYTAAQAEYKAMSKAPGHDMAPSHGTETLTETPGH